MTSIFRTLLLALVTTTTLRAQNRPNLLFVIMDDLNTNFEAVARRDDQGKLLPGQIMAITPNMDALAQSGLSFNNAFSNIPLCNPSRASMLTGILPNQSRFYEFGNTDWKDNPVLSSSKNVFEMLLTDGAYANYFTGKVFHAFETRGFTRTNGIAGGGIGYYPTYRRVVTDASGNNTYYSTPRPDTPASASAATVAALGDPDANFGPLSMLMDFPDLVWYRENHNRQFINRFANNDDNSRAGDFSFQDYFENYSTDVGDSVAIGDITNWYDPQRVDEFYYQDDANRDQWNDELSVTYFKRMLADHYSNGTNKTKPFCFSVGLVLPHAPYIAPDKYFEMYGFHDGPEYTWDSPLPNLDISGLLTLMDTSGVRWPGYDNQRGHATYQAIKDAYAAEPDQFVGIKQFIHAYLACATFADDLFGQLMEHLRVTDDPNHPGKKLIDTTVVVLTSDHGYHVGERENFWKYTLWDDGSRVPLIISDPRRPASHGRIVNEAVSLIDFYPTLVELAFGAQQQAVYDTRVIDPSSAVDIDGTSLVPFLDNPDLSAADWGGLDMVPILVKTAFGDSGQIPAENSVSLRTKDFRYIRYGSQKESNNLIPTYEEFYDYRSDPQEQDNLIDDPAYGILINDFRLEADARFSSDPEDPWYREPAILGTERLIAGFHSPLKGSSTAAPLTGVVADDTINPLVSVTVSHSPSNDLADPQFHTPSGLVPMLTEVSLDTTYGDPFVHQSATPVNPSSFSIDGRATNHLLFHFQNPSSDEFELTSLVFDLKTTTSTDQTFRLVHVPDISAMKGNGYEYQGSEYPLVVQNPSTTSFAPVRLTLESIPRSQRLLTAGGELYLALDMAGGGLPLRFIDNLGWGGLRRGLPLAFLEQPASDAEVVSGSPTSLEVNVQGDDPTFQWYRGITGDTSQLVAGATAHRLDLANFTVEDSGSYWVRVTHPGGSIDSQSYQRTVVYPTPSAELVLAAWHTPELQSGQINQFSNLGLAGVQAQAQLGRRVSLDVHGLNSDDGSFGSFPFPAGTPPVTVTRAFELDRGNTSNRYIMELTIANHRASAITLRALRMDCMRLTGGSNELTVWYRGGDLDTAANVALFSTQSLPAGTFVNIDAPMTELDDTILEPGESANFQLNISYYGEPSTISTVIDNLAFTGTYITGTSTTSPAITEFEDWVAGQATGGLNGRLDDPDHDGMHNFLEYALLGSATVADSPTILPRIEIDGSLMHFHYRVGSRHLRYIVEHSHDLENWTEIVKLPGSLEPGLEYTQSFLMTTRPGFVRLKVSP